MLGGCDFSCWPLCSSSSSGVSEVSSTTSTTSTSSSLANSDFKISNVETNCTYLKPTRNSLEYSKTKVTGVVTNNGDVPGGAEIQLDLESTSNSIMKTLKFVVPDNARSGGTIASGGSLSFSKVWKIEDYSTHCVNISTYHLNVIEVFE